MMTIAFEACAALVVLVLAAALVGSHSLHICFLVLGCFLLGAIVGGVLGFGSIVLCLEIQPDPGGFAGFAAYPVGVAGAVIGAMGGVVLALIANSRGNDER